MSVAVLIAIGVIDDRRREVLGVSVGASTNSLERQVPLFNLLGLSALLITTQRRNAQLFAPAYIYRIVDSIGRWSMIDVLMVSILTATARMGTLGSVFPGLGAVAFCAVVVLTMLADHINSEVKRHTDAVGVFPNDKVIYRLVGAIPMEQNDEWARMWTKLNAPRGEVLAAAFNA